MTKQVMMMTGAGAPRAVRLRLWVLALALAISYIAIVTEDTYVLRVPLKLYLVAIAMGAWWWQVGRHKALRDYALGLPILVFATAIPITWSLVAALHASGVDPVGIHRLTWTLQEASRFIYVLLYFPLVDTRSLYGTRGDRVWLLPILALCVITIALFACHYIIGEPNDTISFLVFRGVFEGNSGGFRVFIGNQVLLILATAFLVANLAVLGVSRARIGCLGLLIVSAYLSHTRGIWLGLSVVCAGILMALLWTELTMGRRRLMLGVASGLAIAVTLFGIAMLADVVPRPPFLADASAGSRVSQAPKLWDAFLQNPVFGDGLGAVIKPRFVRDPAAPWSYELTYLQILFQMGIVGLIAVLMLPLAAVRRALKTVRPGQLQAAPLAGAVGILGVLVASATNPYLLSGFGMLAITIALSLTDSGSSRTSPSKPKAVATA